MQEISTNDAYIISDQKYPVVFEYAGQDNTAAHISVNDGNAIENELIYGYVSGKKSDEYGKALGGALIGIFKTGTTEFTKETAIATAVSAEDGSFSFAKVPYGTWAIREIESPKGFVLSEEEIAVTISEVERKVEIGLVNYFIKGNIEMTKVDEDYPENKLSGAVFEVYSDTNGDGKLDKDDVLLGTMRELEGGIYKMKELRYDKYLVREKTAPTGFVLDENVYAIFIEENGKTYTVENKASAGYILPADKQAAVQVGATTIVQMHNELRDTPKTGDDFNAALWVSLAAALTIGAGVVGFLEIKGKKKKED